MNVVRERLCFRFNAIPGSDSVSLESELRPKKKEQKTKKSNENGKSHIKF